MKKTTLKPPTDQKEAFVKSKNYFSKVYSIHDPTQLNKLGETYSMYLRQGKDPEECETIALMESDYFVNNTVIDIAEDVADKEISDDVVNENLSKFDRNTIEKIEDEYESVNNECIEDDAELIKEIRARIKKRTNRNKLKKQIIENARFKRGQDITEKEANELVDLIIDRKATDIAKKIERKIDTIEDLDKQTAEEGLVDFGLTWGYTPYVKLTDRSKKIIKNGLVNMVTNNMQGWKVNPKFEGWK